MRKYKKDDPTIEMLDKLYEETAEQLKSNTWPRIRVRVGTQNIKAHYLGCTKEGILNFKCNSGTTPGLWWYQKVEFANLGEAVKTLNMSLLARKKKIVQMLIKGDIKIYCNCPCWHYYFKYTAWKNGYGIARETRPSLIRNPKQDKSLDKHLYAVLILLPQIADRILSDYKKQKVLPSFFSRVKSRVTRK